VIVGNYVAAGILFCLGVLAIVGRRNLIKIVLGLSLMESSTYLLLVSMAYKRGSTAPVLASRPAGVTTHELAHGNVADPVLQNFCITAIAVTAVFLTVVVRVAQHYRSLDSADIRELKG